MDKIVDGYNSYMMAKDRCRNHKSKKYKDYGGRGIEFRFNSFAEFFAHLGQKPTPLHSLDRIDNEGHYEMGNVRWATKSEQMSNTVHGYSLSRFAERYSPPAMHRFLGIGNYSRKA